MEVIPSEIEYSAFFPLLSKAFQFCFCIEKIECSSADIGNVKNFDIIN